MIKFNCCFIRFSPAPFSVSVAPVKGGGPVPLIPNPAERNLLLLESMLPASERFYIWCYGPGGDMIATSCPQDLAAPLDQAFRTLGCLEQARSCLQNPSIRLPRVLGSPAGLQWAVTAETAPDRNLLFICGPVFHTLPDPKGLRDALESGVRCFGPRDWIGALCAALPRMPVLSWPVFSRYVLMTHNTLTGQQLGLEALSLSEAGPLPEPRVGERNRLEVYQAEQALLQMVREGNINYQSVLHNSASLSPGVPVQGRDPLRQMKTSIIVFTTLVSRAAMEGGLSPETAYPLGDSYIQAAEDCRDSGELNAMAQAMYHEFIYLVHRQKSNPGFSHAVQKCCDYIELSLDRKITAGDLAVLVGYSEYYLTEKFRQETGLSVTAWIRNARVARARMLLESTALSVADISDRLAFATPSYFIRSFREVTGVTPARYRKQAHLPKQV